MESNNKITPSNVSYNTQINVKSNYNNFPVSSEELAKLNGIRPDLADRVFNYLEVEQKHRHSINNQAVGIDKNQIETFRDNCKSSHNRQLIALLSAAVIIVIALSFSFILLLMDRKLSGSIFGGIGIASLLVSFYSLLKVNKKQQEHKI